MNKTTLTWATSAALTLSIVSSNLAVGEESGWYANGSINFTQLSDTDNTDKVTTTNCPLLISCSTSQSETRYESKFGDDTYPSITLGYDAEGPYRTEIEYRQFSSDIEGNAAPASDDARDSQAFTFNLWRDFEPLWGLSPYLGGGLGVALVEQGKIDDRLAFAQIGAGVSWFFTERWGIDAGYRYFMGEPNAILSNSARELTTDYEGHTLTLGIRYNFFDRELPPKDNDGDGVVDDLDRCPATPRGETVNGEGCPLDSDRDGYANSKDACPNSAPGATVDSTGCEIVKDLVLDGINFETNSAKLTQASAQICEETADKLATIPAKRYEIQGHTDDRGSSAYNLTLSQQRAEAVRRCLIDEGVAPNRLVAKGYGESSPIESNENAEGRRQNRRVVLSQIQ